MQVLNKFILIRKINEKKSASSGLILTGNDSNEMRYHKAEVVEKGDAVECLDKGQEILYDKVSCYDVIIGTERLSVIQEKDVVCVLC